MNNKDKILNEAKRIEEDSLYSAKGHFYAGQCWANVNLWFGCIAAILSAIAGASALSHFDYHSIIAGGLSIIVAGDRGRSQHLNIRLEADISPFWPALRPFRPTG